MIVFDYRPPSPGLRDYVRLYQIVGFEFKENEIVPWKPYWPRPENCLSFYPRKTEIIESAQGEKNSYKSALSSGGSPAQLLTASRIRILCCSRSYSSREPCSG